MTDRRRLAAHALLTATALLAGPDLAAGQERPFVPGGITDKPFIGGASRTSFGGYMESALRWEREQGLTEELTFGVERFNLFAYAPVADRLRVAAEIEFEEQGEEVTVEAALVDFELHPAATLRAGILLSPLGRFNLAHDSPANELTDRPLVSTELIGTALSEAGMGFYGAVFPTAASRVTYEVYAVNGFGDGVVLGDPAGTRVPAGKHNLEDNNRRPSVVGRIAVSPTLAVEVGAAVHAGPYNTWEVDGLRVDERRDLTLVVVDGQWAWRGFEVLGEYARAAIDVPAQDPLLAGGQSGLYAQLNAPFGRGWLANLPGSRFTGVARYDRVDFDTDVDGDARDRLTLGLNLRPVPDTAFKLDYQRSRERDGFDNEVKAAAVLFSVATYF